jgi:hypothetical protein
MIESQQWHGSSDEFRQGVPHQQATKTSPGAAPAVNRVGSTAEIFV